MIHVTCDACGKTMCMSDDDRYVVMIDVRPAQDGWQLTDDDLEPDNLERVSQLIAEAEAAGLEPYERDRKSIRYDLCSACRAEFVKNPLRQKAAAKFDFSKN